MNSTYIMQKTLLLAFLFCSATAFAQKYSGQWSGSFDAKGEPGGSRTEYFLELEVNGNKVEGTSTTYFVIEGKRFYTICAIEGTLDPSSKTITAKEVRRVKANTPQWFKDCFQVHTLTYFKKGDTEELEGNWKGAVEASNCGSGTTVLSRKQLVKNIITKAIGTEASVDPTVNLSLIVPGDMYLVCSDGLSDLLSKGEIEAYLNQSHTVEEKVRALIHAAKKNGGYDNITVVLVEITEDNAKTVAVQ